MSYKRSQRRKRQRREQPPWYLTEPKWTALNAVCNARVFYHPLAGLTSRYGPRFLTPSTIPYVRHSARRGDAE